MDAAVAILIVANDPLTRAGLAALLATTESLDVLGQIATADLEVGIETYDPDVLIWIADADAFSHETDIEELPPIVALTADDEIALQWWQTGVAGLLPRAADAEQVAAAAAAVLHDLNVIAPDFVDLIGIQSAVPSVLPEPLSARELEVLNLIAEGLPNKTIAERLFISQNTVKFHLNAILQKLDAQNRTEAAVKAARLGVINL